MAVKTNAMRILDSMKIPYTLHTYTCDEFIDGEQIADMLGLPYEKVYKTLVAQGSRQKLLRLCDSNRRKARHEKGGCGCR